MLSEDDEENSTGQVISLDELFTRLYTKIRILAARVRWTGANPTLNPTALVHEAYLKLRKSSQQQNPESDGEVIRILATAMQQILIDAAKRRSAPKRMPVDPVRQEELPIEDAITLRDALEKLESENPRAAQVVRCRFYLGMTAPETSAVLRLSKRTVEREWQTAKANLSEEIERGTK